MEIVEKIKAEMAAFDEKRKELTAQLKKDFPALLAPLFEKYPGVKNVRWTQYTPYFNDGDPCEFSTNAGYAELNYDGNEDDDDDEKKRKQRRLRMLMCRRRQKMNFRMCYHPLMIHFTKTFLVIT